MMPVPRITIVFEPTEEQAAEWQGRFAVIAPMNQQEWLDLWKFLATIDGFVEQVAQSLLAIRKALETGNALPTEAMQNLIALTEDAQGAAGLMPAVHYLMNRFAMVADARAEKERLQ